MDPSSDSGVIFGHLCNMLSEEREIITEAPKVESDRVDALRPLSDIEYKNDFVETFDGDQSGDLTSRETPGKFYSRATPTPVKRVDLLAWNEELAADLEIRRPENQRDVDILGGNEVA